MNINKTPLRKNTILICLMIGLSFLWTGSGYLSWLYHLIAEIDINGYSISADLLSEVIGYLFQALGLGAVAFTIYKGIIKEAQLKAVFIACLTADLIFICLANCVSGFYPVLICGYIMNLLHGVVSAMYLIYLACRVPCKHAALTFGIGYSIGSLGSWLLSIIGDSNFLKNKYVLIVYIFLGALTVILVNLIGSDSIDAKASSSQNQEKSDVSVKFVILLSIMVLMLCITKGIGFYFPMADISKGSISLEFSRIFYAVGLVIAGILTDYKRQFGAVACIGALVFPFILIALQTSQSSSLTIWIIGYMFSGFYAVYRVIVFTDFTNNNHKLLYFAPLGLLIGRIGDATGSLLGMAFTKHTVELIIVGAFLYAATIIICTYLFPKLYHVEPVILQESAIDPTQKLDAFCAFHDLSSREKEVLSYIIEGKSNGEISDTLFVSENTVKFHVRNILKKIGANNRNELKRIYHGDGSSVT